MLQDFVLTDDDQQHSHEGQEGDVERAAERHAGDDEGHDEDEEADDHQRGHGFGPGCGGEQKQRNHTFCWGKKASSSESSAFRTHTHTHTHTFCTFALFNTLSLLQKCLSSLPLFFQTGLRKPD